MLLQLHDKGTLSLEDKLSKWFPDSQVRLRHPK
jgi:CubicO group peptidase (beta-lactamase class C family)